MSSKEKEVVNKILTSRYSHIDHEWGVIFNIFDMFGFSRVDENDEPVSIDDVITKDFLENHSLEILDNLPSDNEYHQHLNHLVLAALIIDKKAKISQNLKERILHAISWEAELKWRWRTIDKTKEKEFLDERRNLIASFRQIVEEYPSKDP